MENKEQVLNIVCEALATNRERQKAEQELASAQRSAAFWKSQLEYCQREEARLTAAIQELKFHDIGHARGELRKVDDRMKAFESRLHD